MTDISGRLNIKSGYWSQILFIVAGSAILLYGIIFLNKNFFFVIYIFWFESLIRVLFNYIRIRKAGKDITQMPEITMTSNGRELSLADYNNRPYYARFYASINLFLLFTYWVFIIVMVGFVIPLSIDDRKMLVQNILIMLFRDSAFLLALMVFFCRSLADYLSGYILNNDYKNTTVLMVGPVFERQNLVMHISLIAGMGFWFLVNRYLPAYSSYAMIGLATAFVLVKLIVDLYGSHAAFKNVKD